MLMELLSKAATVATLSFVVSSMLAMGAGLTVSQISEPLRNARLTCQGQPRICRYAAHRRNILDDVRA